LQGAEVSFRSDWCQTATNQSNILVGLSQTKKLLVSEPPSRRLDKAKTPLGSLSLSELESVKCGEACGRLSQMRRGLSQTESERESCCK